MSRQGTPVYLGATKKEEKTLDLPEDIVKVFRCERCNKPFKNAGALKFHMTKHKYKGKDANLLNLQP
jgi:endonuclease I